MRAEQVVQLTLTHEEAVALRRFTMDFDGEERHRLSDGDYIDSLVCNALIDTIGNEPGDDDNEESGDE